MHNLFNVVIPSITTDYRLLRCLNGLNKLKYKKFFVTLILENKLNIYKIKKNLNFKVNIIVQTKKINMSEKRNVGVNKFKSKYIAFIDSDACPDIYWLTNALKQFKKGYKVIGGPNIPFKDQSYLQKISYYCKRSFFVTAHYNFIKYKSFNKICDWLDSSNFVIERDLYKSINGMDEKLYIGEDHDFFYRLKFKYKNIKILFVKNVFVYHEDREIHLYCLQRFVYGLNVFSAKNTFVKRSIALLPSLLIILIILGCYIFTIGNFFKFFLVAFLFVSILILYEISRYINKFSERLFTLFGIYLVNFFYGIGTLLSLVGFRGYFEKKIYRNIKKNK